MDKLLRLAYETGPTSLMTKKWKYMADLFKKTGSVLVLFIT